MTKSLPFALLAGAALLSGSTAIAATKTTTKAGTPAAKPMTAGHMVTTKTKTGKTVTYNCSKAGNANKAACKK